MTLNASTLKVDESAMKENVIHKPLINRMIYTLKDDIECLYSESWWIDGKGGCDTQAYDQSHDLCFERWHWMPLLRKLNK